MIDLNDNEVFINPMKPLEFGISLLVERYDRKTIKNYQHFIRCRKAHSLKTIDDINSKIL